MKQNDLNNDTVKWIILVVVSVGFDVIINEEKAKENALREENNKKSRGA